MGHQASRVYRSCDSAPPYPVGEVWPIDEINKRKGVIEEAGMTWTVIESLPESEDIKKQSGNYYGTLKTTSRVYET
jgi:D-mannonate dehydratase